MKRSLLLEDRHEGYPRRLTLVYASRIRRAFWIAPGGRAERVEELRRADQEVQRGFRGIVLRLDDDQPEGLSKYLSNRIVFNADPRCGIVPVLFKDDFYRNLLADLLDMADDAHVPSYLTRKGFQHIDRLLERISG